MNILLKNKTYLSISLLYFVTLFIPYAYQVFVLGLQYGNPWISVLIQITLSFFFGIFVFSSSKVLTFINVFLYLLVLIPSLFYLYFLALYKAPPSYTEYSVLFESNIFEASEFFQTLPLLERVFFILTIFVFLLFPIFVFFKLIKNRSFQKRGILIGISFFLISFFVSSGFRNFENSGLIVYRYLKHYAKVKDQVYHRKKILPSFKQLGIQKRSSQKATHVLILGESTTRGYMGLYGFPENTNPKLSQRKDLFVFSNAISPERFTTISLLKSLSFLKREDKVNEFNNTKTNEKTQIPASKYINIMDILKSSGFFTVWINNQRPIGQFAYVIEKEFAFSADELLQLNQNFHSLDEVVLAPLKKALKKQGNLFIVIHLLGTHFSYKERHPLSFSKFKPKDSSKKEKIISQYKNAILYNDFIVNEIIETVRQQKPFSTVTYFSDHGEDVFFTKDSYGHVGQPSAPMFEVPFLFWASKNYKKANPLLFSQIKKSLDKPYVLDNFIHFYSNLVGVKTKHYEKENDIISPYFSPPTVRYMEDQVYPEK